MTDSRDGAYFAVDQVDGNQVTLIGDDGRQYEVLRSSLPSPLEEGSVLMVRLADGVQPLWEDARLAPDERERRLKRAAELLEHLGQSDSGEDVVL
jgi:hypothetical protein